MKIFRKKFSIIRAGSLGLIILGFGFIVFALVQIGNSSGITQTIEIEANNAQAEITSTGTEEYIDSSEIQEDTPVQVDEDIILYPIRPKIGDSIGKLVIPALKQFIPIIHGADEDELEKGVGHFAQSVLPGEANNSVLSGHRDTVFSELGILEIGDELITETSAGRITYIIKEIRIVDKEDKTIIVPTDHAVLTVTTCYPFGFIGNAPERYILIADLSV